ncbi:hypothetical protein Pint_25887 [Pistacia integerrima]|uniref:Uncharacterized protein n=1 Tax=Pistacia integerrima TaxID=434235 RepID=A0ACC0YEG9_9ROSI|nr:hypothetical protein Pint_25887 [Pistacia integerrima]
MDISQLLLVPSIFLMLISALNFPEIVAAEIQVSSITSLPDFSSENLVETNNVSQPMTEKDNTERVDPLNDLKKYKGGFNITNKHYWSSTAFTGIYGYAIGALWLLGGIIYGGFVVSKILFCKKRREEKLKKKRAICSNQCYFWPIVLATFFTILAIVASGLVLGGNEKFNSRASKIVDIIINTANEASETLYNTTEAMKEMENNLESSNGPSDTSVFLSSTSQKLEDEAAVIERQARKNRRLIDKGLKIVYVVTTVTVSLNLVALIALSVSGVFRFQKALNLLITLCWIFTFLCWMLFGVYFFLERFSSDSCTALENFKENPNNNSLSSILPCDELRSAESVLFDFSTGVYKAVNEVNENISISFPSIPHVCNPFSGPPNYKYLTGYCPENTIQIGDIPKVLKVFTCSDANNGTCGEEGFFITSNEYTTVKAYTSSIQNLLNVYPDMENLIECQSVKDAFSEILVKHCKPLKRNVHLVWSSLVFLSIVMVFLVLIWNDQAQNDQELHSSDGSVIPHFGTPNVSKCETTKEGSEDHQIPV